MASLNVGSRLQYQAAAFGRTALFVVRANSSAQTVISENRPSKAGVVRRKWTGHPRKERLVPALAAFSNRIAVQIFGQVRHDPFQTGVNLFDGGAADMRVSPMLRRVTVREWRSNPFQVFRKLLCFDPDILKFSIDLLCIVN